MNIFASLKTELQQYMTGNELASIEKAYEFSKKAHGDQIRYSGEPYITHPVAVALILAEMRMDVETITAAILHDVIEDTSVNTTNIINQFGQEVSNLVDGVTKLTQINFENHAQAQAENFRKMIMAMASDIRIILVKLADRLHNMRTIHGLPAKKRRRIALETLEIFAPIANRLGMHAFRVELEDLGFRALYPLRYKILKTAVEKAGGNRHEIMALIETQIREAITKAQLSSVNLSSRGKHLYSIYKKMHEKHLSFSEIMDVYGFRITVGKVDTCYRVLGLLHGLFKPISQRFKDYIAIPKANGYQSLHTILFGPYGVPIEAQIRTEEMHKVAENGIAAHWLYKTEKKALHDVQSRANAWLQGMVEMDQSARNSLEFIEHVKSDLFPDEVYVFTPKGKIIELPFGATAVDFAYAIHSAIGNTCVAVKIDKRLSPLSMPLESGQQVEIITTQNARPNAAWLNFVVTGKARSHIKHYLKRQQHAESIALGKRLTEKALFTYGLELGQIATPVLQAIVDASQLESIAHLFEEVGMGNRPAPLVAKQISKSFSSQLTSGDALHPLTIQGTEGLVLSYAKCCRPIPGDHIAGLIKEGQGLEVHLMSCPHLLAFQHQVERCVPLLWENNIAGDFSVDIQIDLLNKRGSLGGVTTALAELDANIMTLRAQESDVHHFHVEMTVTVKNRSHLARIMRKLHRQSDVIRILRLKSRAV
ncbi:MAG: bifunctional GTP diphosphokinase/guanosine-3',5'-bis(diphosphate) 3'-diphosphatase [Gammaproteobacteria bacterium RIFCSPHIGHO2_12_FULL_42_10]|nr:MAG: bifunctional GTP diphosphokinase/guanosine-3',5'-bis(diphosphate) 3'-diphosphatase [Gammaproteobacteria bacterium RIFCSPHIGHO2_12_FULL_42_10]